MKKRCSFRFLLIFLRIFSFFAALTETLSLSVTSTIELSILFPQGIFVFSSPHLRLVLLLLTFRGILVPFSFTAISFVS